MTWMKNAMPVTLVELAGSAHCHVAQPVVRPTEGYPLVGKMQQNRFDSSKILLYMYCMHSIVYIKCGVSVVKYVLNYL